MGSIIGSLLKAYGLQSTALVVGVVDAFWCLSTGKKNTKLEREYGIINQKLDSLKEDMSIIKKNIMDKGMKGK